MKALVILEDGVVRTVLTDHKALDVLVLDRDDSGGAPTLQVAGGPAALDAMAQGLPKVAKARVGKAFARVRQQLAKGAITQAALRKALQPGDGPDFDTVAAEEGWSDATQLSVLQDFVDELGLADALGRYAARRAS